MLVREKATVPQKWAIRNIVPAAITKEGFHGGSRLCSLVGARAGLVLRRFDLRARLAEDADEPADGVFLPAGGLRDLGQRRAALPGDQGENDCPSCWCPSLPSRGDRCDLLRAGLLRGRLRRLGLFVRRVWPSSAGRDGNRLLRGRRWSGVFVAFCLVAAAVFFMCSLARTCRVTTSIDRVRTH